MAKILIVEDVPVQRRHMVETLQRMGHRVNAVEHGAAALAVLKSESGGYDCVVSDLHMPIMDGRELLQQLMKKHPDIPVVILSSDASNDTINEVQKHGAWALLTKPVDGEVLKQTLKEII